MSREEEKRERIRRDLPKSFFKPQPGTAYKLRGQRVEILEVLDEESVKVTTGDVFIARKADLKPLTTDYRYGGVGESRNEDAPVPNGWEKGQ